MAGSRAVQPMHNQQPLPPSGNQRSDGVTAGLGDAGGGIVLHISGRKRNSSSVTDVEKKQTQVSVDSPVYCSLHSV